MIINAALLVGAILVPIYLQDVLGYTATASGLDVTRSCSYGDYESISGHLLTSLVPV